MSSPDAFCGHFAKKVIKYFVNKYIMPVANLFYLVCPSGKNLLKDFSISKVFFYTIESRAYCAIVEQWGRVKQYSTL
jgi:hypothetical protein